MGKIAKLLAFAGLIAAVSACAQQFEEAEFVLVDPEPISTEPTYTGKYK